MVSYVRKNFSFSKMSVHHFCQALLCCVLLYSLPLYHYEMCCFEVYHFEIFDQADFVNLLDIFFWDPLICMGMWFEPIVDILYVIQNPIMNTLCVVWSCQFIHWRMLRHVLVNCSLPGESWWLLVMFLYYLLPCCIWVCIKSSYFSMSQWLVVPYI